MMMRISSILLAMALLLSLSVCVQAHEVPDVTREGSIVITLTDKGEPVPGGTLTLFPVADIVESDGNYSFRWNEDFDESELVLDETTIGSPKLAQDLAEYVARMQYAGETVVVSEKGVAMFGEVMPGLYLIIQEKAADAYEKINPFLVSVPQYKDGKYVYDVDASPKVSDVIEKPTEPEETQPPTTPPPSLPQTGQLNWPVPILAVAGLALFVIGFALQFKRKRD